jgi:hypothetical protein
MPAQTTKLLSKKAAIFIIRPPVYGRLILQALM